MVYLKYTSTHECSSLYSIKVNSYLNNPSTQNDSTYGNLNSTTYESFVQATLNLACAERCQI